MADEIKETVEEKRSMHRGTVFVIIIAICILLMFAGTIVYLKWSRSHEASSQIYNGFAFTKIQDRNLTAWMTTIVYNGNEYRIPFYNHPRDVQNISFDQNLTARFIYPQLRPQIIYLAFSPDEDARVMLAGVELSRLFRPDLMDIPAQGALNAPPPGSEAVVVTCSNATRDIAVINFDLGGKNAVFRDATNPYCIHVEYVSQGEAVVVADRFAYGLLRIIQ